MTRRAVVGPVFAWLVLATGWLLVSAASAQDEAIPLSGEVAGSTKQLKALRIQLTS